MHYNNNGVNFHVNSIEFLFIDVVKPYIKCESEKEREEEKRVTQIYN